MNRFLTMLVLSLLAAPAMAYVGPGAGISVLGSLLGILATIVLAIGAIVLWPIRKMMKKRKAAAEATQDNLDVVTGTVEETVESTDERP